MEKWKLLFRGYRLGVISGCLPDPLPRSGSEAVWSHVAGKCK